MKDMPMTNSAQLQASERREAGPRGSERRANGFGRAARAGGAVSGGQTALGACTGGRGCAAAGRRPRARCRGGRGLCGCGRRRAGPLDAHLNCHRLSKMYSRYCWMRSARGMVRPRMYLTCGPDSGRMSPWVEQAHACSRVVSAGGPAGPEGQQGPARASTQPTPRAAMERAGVGVPLCA